MRITEIGIFVNTTKANAAEIVAEVAQWLQQRDVTPLLADEHAAALGHPKSGMQTSALVTHADMLLVLGGDGTLLSAAHTPGIEDVPLLAINIGTLGFLTDAS
ncbi:NAD(+) kinase, partial [Candidatus Poribacteria bacterium]